MEKVPVGTAPEAIVLVMMAQVQGATVATGTVENAEVWVLEEERGLY